jgi:hypothetical protein
MMEAAEGVHEYRIEMAQERLSREREAAAAELEAAAAKESVEKAHELLSQVRKVEAPPVVTTLTAQMKYILVAFNGIPDDELLQHRPGLEAVTDRGAKRRKVGDPPPVINDESGGASGGASECQDPLYCPEGGVVGDTDNEIEINDFIREYWHSGASGESTERSTKSVELRNELKLRVEEYAKRRTTDYNIYSDYMERVQNNNINQVDRKNVFYWFITLCEFLMFPNEALLLAFFYFDRFLSLSYVEHKELYIPVAAACIRIAIKACSTDCPLLTVECPPDVAPGTLFKPYPIQRPDLEVEVPADGPHPVTRLFDATTKWIAVLCRDLPREWVRLSGAGRTTVAEVNSMEIHLLRVFKFSVYPLVMPYVIVRLILPFVSCGFPDLLVRLTGLTEQVLISSGMVYPMLEYDHIVIAVTAVACSCEVIANAAPDADGRRRERLTEPNLRDLEGILSHLVNLVKCDYDKVIACLGVLYRSVRVDNFY